VSLHMDVDLDALVAGTGSLALQAGPVSGLDQDQLLIVAVAWTSSS